MLSKEYRLRLVEIVCKMKLNREVSLEERIWVSKLCDHNRSAAGIRDRFLISVSYTHLTLPTIYSV